MTSISKAFIDKFAKDYGCLFTPLPEQEVIKLPSCTIGGKLIKDNVTLYVSYVKTKLKNTSVYLQDFNELVWDMQVGDYILVWKNDNSSTGYKIFELIEDKSAKAKSKEQNLKFLYKQSMTHKDLIDMFQNTTASVSKSKVSKIVDEIWTFIKCSGEDRAMFINLCMCLLHTNIIVIKNSLYGDLTMIGFMDKFNELTEKDDRESMDKAFELRKLINSNSIYNALKQIIDKRGNRNEAQSKAIKDRVCNVFDNNREGRILHIISKIYNDLYKPYVHSTERDDFGDLFHQVESKWMSEGKNSQGQVFTPSPVWKLAVKMLGKHINKDTIILDPTCGQGNFTLNLARYCENRKDLRDSVKIIQNDKDTVLSLQVFLRAVCLFEHVQIDTLNEDMFSISEPKENEKANMLLMNPPFAMKKYDKGKSGDRSEWGFILYALEHFCKIGTWFFFVIPISSLSENSKNDEYKEKFLYRTRLDHVITLREDIFKGQNGGKAVALLVGQWFGTRNEKVKVVDEKKYLTKLSDLSDDGGVVKEKKGAYTYDNEVLEKMWKDKIGLERCGKIK